MMNGLIRPKAAVRNHQLAEQLLRAFELARICAADSGLLVAQQLD